jgi:hypothetical protein
MSAPGGAALVVLAPTLWHEVRPGPLHVLAGEAARAHPVCWVEAPWRQALRAPGLHARLRRAIRADLPLIRYVDARRELDVLTPPVLPPGSWAGDALLAQTVRWALRLRGARCRVLWLSRHDAAAAALLTRLEAGVRVAHYPKADPHARFHPAVDLVLWPAGAPVPAGEREDDPRLLRVPEPGVRGAMRLWPMLEGWLEGRPFLGVAETARQARLV